MKSEKESTNRQSGFFDMIMNMLLVYLGTILIVAVVYSSSTPIEPSVMKEAMSDELKEENIEARSHLVVENSIRLQTIKLLCSLQPTLLNERILKDSDKKLCNRQSIRMQLNLNQLQNDAYQNNRNGFLTFLVFAMHIGLIFMALAGAKRIPDKQEDNKQS